ncbi:MAG: DUF2892 domain-containing protein [Gilvibacter sp.]
MKKNIGFIDRGIRVSFAALVIMYCLTGVLNGTLAIGLLIISGVFLLTSVTKFCPVYFLFGFNTCDEQKPRTEP